MQIAAVDERSGRMPEGNAGRQVKGPKGAAANRHAPCTLYRKVQDRLRQEIASGRFKEGDLIPSEQELAKRYGVSQGTARKAVLDLTQRGLFHRRQGKGTFVVFERTNVTRHRNFRFVQGLGADLVTFNLGFLKLDVIRAPAELAAHLRLRKGARIIRLERMGKVGDQCMCTVSYLPKYLYRGLERYTAEEFLRNTLWKLQEIYFHIRVERREEFLSVAAADTHLARLLQVELGSPLLRLEAKLTSFRGEVVEYRDTLCTPGPLKFYVRQPVT
jgi:GntR family transcriptional regulator